MDDDDDERRRRQTDVQRAASGRFPEKQELTLVCTVEAEAKESAQVLVPRLPELNQMAYRVRVCTLMKFSGRTSFVTYLLSDYSNEGSFERELIEVLR